MKRRDFISAGIGGLTGAGLYGLSQKDDPAPDRTPGSSTTKDPRDIANPHHELKGHYAYLIIGSGYGGSVLAARLSATGKDVCVLERGQEWHPGMFPTSDDNITKVSGSIKLIDANVHSKSDVDIICASGLGGTSLINAAISSRPEALVFQQKEWPKEIREDFEKGIISHYMDEAQGVLKAGNSPRTLLMRKAMMHKMMMGARGMKQELLNLNINHHEGKNDYGVEQKACTFCGDCCSGCNVGAKNVLTVNYLPFAKYQGAEIFTSMSVSFVEKRKDGKYLVHYSYRKDGISEEGTIATDNLIIAAGSMGTTQIMMKSRLKGLRVSKALGTRFSANGDVMGFSYNGAKQTDVLGHGLDSRPKAPSGQALMVYSDYRRAYSDPGKVDLMERFLLLDGTIPSPLGPLVSKGLAAYAMANNEKFNEEQIKRIQHDILSLGRPPVYGALNHSMIFFACGHDSSKGRYVLDDFEDRVHVKWANVTEEKGFQYINKELSRLSTTDGGLYIPNPRMTVFGKRMMATHPLGGCPMGQDAQSGVVDHYGRVFTEDGDIHNGLYIVDASILPRSLGATPLVTISALAERISDFINGVRS